MGINTQMKRVVLSCTFSAIKAIEAESLYKRRLTKSIKIPCKHKNRKV